MQRENKIASGVPEAFQQDPFKKMDETAFRKHLEYISRHSKFYIRKLGNDFIHRVGSIQLSELPFTTKEELSQHNDDFVCIGKNEIADIVTTSGTTHKPVTFYLTAADLERLAINESFALSCTGANANDLFQLMTTIDKQFMAGLAYQLGIRKLGAGIIRVGPGSPMLQLDSIMKYKPTVLIAVPSFIPKLISFAREHNIDLSSGSVHSVICIGESIRNPDFTLNELGKRITDQWKVNLFSTYASTEMSAAFTECSAGCGGHHNPELSILEVIKENNAAALHGEMGEVVITPLGVTGMPLIRFRTGDLCHVYYDVCQCGRHSARLGPVVGRKNQMIKYKGTTIYPPAIFDVLDMIRQLDIYQVEISRDEFGNDKIRILIPDSLQTAPFSAEIQTMFKTRLRVVPEFVFIPVRELEKKVMPDNKRKPEKIIYL